MATNRAYFVFVFAQRLSTLRGILYGVGRLYHTALLNPSQYQSHIPWPEELSQEPLAIGNCAIFQWPGVPVFIAWMNLLRLSCAIWPLPCSGGVWIIPHTP